MALMLKRQRNGQLRGEWYGVYTEDGRRKVVNLDVKWHGTPPPSFKVSDPGDRDFEDSRKEAKKALKNYVEDAQHKGRVEHLTERLIESKTGSRVEYTRIEELADKWLSITRDAPLSEGYTVVCRSCLGRFVTFMRERKPKARLLYQVTAADASAFAEYVRGKMSPRTYAAHLGILRPAFDHFLPPGSTNPFRVGLKGKRRSKTEDTGSVHRKPFTPEELQKLVNAANGDPLMGGLITAAACTGMRRGDVCRLKWTDIDLSAGMLTVKTSKTGAQVEIPIFSPLRAVLNEHKGNGSEYVFPSAARMLAENPDGLTWRFKKIAVKALDSKAVALPPPCSPANIEAEGADAIAERLPEGARRTRMLDTFRRYCAGESVRKIEKETSRIRSTVAIDLHAVESMIGKRFMTNTDDIKSAIARLTRVPREKGQRSASIRDWHALRTTFVTLALSAGVPLELVRRVTGHQTVEIVLKHYFRPDREQFKTALVGAMPKVLTGKTLRLKPAERLAALSVKLVAGSMTEKEKTQLKKLAENL